MQHNRVLREAIFLPQLHFSCLTPFPSPPPPPQFVQSNSIVPQPTDQPTNPIPLDLFLPTIATAQYHPRFFCLNHQDVCTVHIAPTLSFSRTGNAPFTPLPCNQPILPFFLLFLSALLSLFSALSNGGRRPEPNYHVAKVGGEGDQKLICSHNPCRHRRRLSSWYYYYYVLEST